MSILIKGIELPKNCYECQFAANYFRPTHTSGRKPCSFACVLTQKALTSTKRSRFCPLVELPPHGDLIDRHNLKNKEITIDYDEWDDTFDDGLLFVADLIDNAPTIIEAEDDNGQTT